MDGSELLSPSHSPGPNTLDGNESLSHSHSSGPTTVDGSGLPSHSHSPGPNTSDGSKSLSPSHSLGPNTLDGSKSLSHSHSPGPNTLDGSESLSHSHLSGPTTVDGSGLPSHSHLPGPTTMDCSKSHSHSQYDCIQTPDILSFGEEQQHLKTKLAKVFSKVLGTDKTIKTFDSIRHVIKITKQEGRKVSLAQAREHEQLKNQIHTNTIQRKEMLKQELRSYERDYFRRHGLLPRQDTDEQYKLLVKQRHNIKWLLSTWTTTCT